MHSSDTRTPISQVADRADLPRSFLNTAWPLLAAALILLMLVRACMPVSPVTPPPFDPAAATRQANDTALSALQALPPQPALPEAIAALNRIVVNFASGADDLPEDAADLLRQAAAVIAKLPTGTRLLIIGHTDNVGNTAANQSLSLRRAEAVRSALIAQGAPLEMLTTEGRGDTQPVAGNDTEAGRFRNRRLEFAIAP